MKITMLDLHASHMVTTCVMVNNVSAFSHRLA